MTDSAEARKQLIDQACRTAKEFLDHYYVKVDSKRHAVAKTYLETATLSWNGNRVDGPEAIQKFFTDNVPSTSHQIHSYDAQPVLDEFVGGQKTVMVHVGGTVKFANDSRPRPFQQNFLLTAVGDYWKVATDVFRYQDFK